MIKFLLKNRVVLPHVTLISPTLDHIISPKEHNIRRRIEYTFKKSRIRETKHLSTDADCGTNKMRGLGSEDVTCVGQVVS